MGRILFFVALFAAIWIAWMISRRKNGLSNEERRELKRLRAKERESEGKPREPAGEAMVQCDACGVFFPKREAVLRGEHKYCSRRCRDRAEENR